MGVFKITLHTDALRTRVLKPGMAQSRPFSGNWSNAKAAPGLFPAVSRANPFTFPVGDESSQPGNAMIQIGYTNPFRWRDDKPFDALQVQRELIFVMPWATGDFPDQPRFLSLGQVNLVLKDAWTKFQNLVTLARKNPTAPGVKEALEYRDLGEDFYASDNEEILYGREYRFDEAKKPFSMLGRLAIMSQFVLFGVKKTSASGAGGIAGDRSCTVVQNGQSIVLNYWKESEVGDDLWVILKKPDSQGPYEFVPWAGRGSPTSADLMYQDHTGRMYVGKKYRVGQVTRGNHLVASEKRRQAILGVGENVLLETVKQTAENTPTLDINMAIGDDA